MLRMGLEKLILDKEKLKKFNIKAEALRWLELGHVSSPGFRDTLNGGGYMLEEITPTNFSPQEISGKAEEVKRMLFDRPGEWSYQNGGEFIRKEAPEKLMDIGFRGPVTRVDVGYGNKEIGDPVGLTKKVMKPVPHLLMVDGVGKSRKEKLDQLEQLTEQINRNTGIDWSLTREGKRDVLVREFPINPDLFDSYVAQSLSMNGVINGKYKVVSYNPKLKNKRG